MYVTKQTQTSPRDPVNHRTEAVSSRRPQTQIHENDTRGCLFSPVRLPHSLEYEWVIKHRALTFLEIRSATARSKDSKGDRDGDESQHTCVEIFCTAPVDFYVHHETLTTWYHFRQKREQLWREGWVGFFPSIAPFEASGVSVWLLCNCVHKHWGHTKNAVFQWVNKGDCDFSPVWIKPFKACNIPASPPLLSSPSHPIR